MNEQIESLIKKIALRDVHLKMIEKENQGLVISKEVVLEIIEELDKQYGTN